MIERVTKEIAQMLKECGFDIATNALYKDSKYIIGDIDYENWNLKEDTISAPTVYEAIEGLDSEGVCVVPMRNVNTGRWIAEIQIDGQGFYFYNNMLVSHPTRSSAYLAGIEAACNFLIKKEKTND